MVPLGIALLTSLVISLAGTPVLIRLLRKHQYGQFIRKDGPTAHYTKRGTPTMGGIVIILATVCGWSAAHIASWTFPSASGWLLMLLILGLGLIGFLDDYIKISRQRSLGLTGWAKIAGQLAVGTTFGVLALLFPRREETGIAITPASTKISLVRDIDGLDLAFAGVVVAFILFAIWANFLIAAWSNGVNLTDGLDGLASGACLFAFGAYTGVATWQYYQRCPLRQVAPQVMDACYEVRDPADLAIISLAIVGACFGFLWWNTSPAQIFMGDTGSLALGGAFAGLSILTRTEFLAVIIGGLFVMIVMSDVIQVGVFKLTGKRVFKMAPLHHHFELKGWKEVTIVVRFWIIAGLFAIAGVALFYAEWVVAIK